MFILLIQNNGCAEKVWCKRFVFEFGGHSSGSVCANNTTRDSVVCGAKVVCYIHVCANLENIFKIRWDQEEVVVRVIYATQRIAKESVSHQLYANLENILKTH